MASAANAASAPLHVEGNRVLKSANQSVTLTGVNVPSLEWGNEGETHFRFGARGLRRLGR